MSRTEQPKVEPGQVWADNDKRSRGRLLRVDRVEDLGGGPYAYCTIVENDDRTRHRIEGGSPLASYDQRGKKTRLMVRRMRPNSTGYRLVHEADPRLPGFPLCSCSGSSDGHEGDCPQGLYSPDDI